MSVMSARVNILRDPHNLLTLSAVSPKETLHSSNAQKSTPGRSFVRKYYSPGIQFDALSPHLLFYT